MMCESLVFFGRGRVHRYRAGGHVHKDMATRCAAFPCAYGQTHTSSLTSETQPPQPPHSVAISAQVVASFVSPICETSVVVMMNVDVAGAAKRRRERRLRSMTSARTADRRDRACRGLASRARCKVERDVRSSTGTEDGKLRMRPPLSEES